MKKLFIYLLLCTPGLASAQSQFSQFYIGGQAGVTVPFIVNQNNYGLPEMDYKNSVSYEFGAVAGIRFDSKHNLQFELTYTDLGQNYEDSYKPGSVRFTLNKRVDLSYLQVPVLYKFVINRVQGVYDFGRRPNLFITAGPQLSVLMTSKVQYAIDGTDATWRQVDDAFINDVIDPDIVALNPATEGEPVNSDDLFTPFALDAVLGMGLQMYIADDLLLFAEGRGFISVNDINAPAFRAKNNDQVYGASRNFAGGFRLGLVYHLGQ